MSAQVAQSLARVEERLLEGCRGAAAPPGGSGSRGRHRGGARKEKKPAMAWGGGPQRDGAAALRGVRRTAEPRSCGSVSGGRCTAAGAERRGASPARWRGGGPRWWWRGGGPKGTHCWWRLGRRQTLAAAARDSESEQQTPPESESVSCPPLDPLGSDSERVGVGCGMAIRMTLSESCGWLEEAAEAAHIRHAVTVRSRCGHGAVTPSRCGGTLLPEHGAEKTNGLAIFKFPNRGTQLPDASS
jgi:hypothetical protein